MQRPDTNGELAFLLRLRKRLLAEFDKGTSPEDVLQMMEQLIREARAQAGPSGNKPH